MNHDGPSAESAVRAAVIGAGSIGIAFALVFARAAWQVKLFDPDGGRRRVALGELRARIEGLVGHGLVAESVEALIARVDVVATVEEAVRDAHLVQECAPELVELKRQLFAEFDAAAPEHAVLASSSSALSTSRFAAELAGRARCLVAHPGNPPYLLPIIEIVPAPFTHSSCIDRADALYRAAGLIPVRVAKEVEGFIFNRLQGALLREAYCLVRDGVASVEDIDTVMTQGLGPRWSIIGPFETVDLNTRGGIASHAQKMGPAYERMGAERGQHDPWTPDLVEKVARERRALVPLEQWEARVDWRDRMLMALMKHRLTSPREPWPAAER